MMKVGHVAIASALTVSGESSTKTLANAANPMKFFAAAKVEWHGIDELRVILFLGIQDHLPLHPNQQSIHKRSILSLN